MAKLTKKQKAAAAIVDSHKLYDIDEAVKLVKEAASAKFDETVEVAFNLNINPKYADQQLRGATVLPAGTGKSKKVLVFAKDHKEDEAKAAGADYVGGKELADKIMQGWMDFDVVVATPDMMAVVGRLGRVLGPKGLMPNPKVGTVTMDVTKAVNEIKGGKVQYRTDKAGNVQVIIGKVSFDEDKLKQNLLAIYNTILKARPSTVKGVYMKSLTISSTMGRGIQVDYIFLKIYLIPCQSCNLRQLEIHLPPKPQCNSRGGIFAILKDLPHLIFTVFFRQAL